MGLPRTVSSLSGYTHALMARTVADPTLVITNYWPYNLPFASAVRIPIGYGLITEVMLLPKPNGAFSHFPFGFITEPDRPRTALI